MPIFAVIRKSDQVEVYRYDAPQAVEWQAFPFATHDHLEQAPEEPELPPTVPDQPSEWWINVGPFYDRFGAYKLPILASTDPLVQAVIKDSSIRKYIDLKGRRAELLQVVGLLQSKGFPINAATLLDVKPNQDEVYVG